MCWVLPTRWSISKLWRHVRPGTSKGSPSTPNTRLHTLIQLIETFHSNFPSRKGFLTLGNGFRSPGFSVVFLSHSPNRYNMISYLFTNRLSHLNLIEVKNVTFSQVPVLINFKIEIMPEVECLYTAEISFNISVSTHLSYRPSWQSVCPGTKYSSNSDLRKTGVTLVIVTDWTDLDHHRHVFHSFIPSMNASCCR